MEWQNAPDIKKEIVKLVSELNFAHVDPQRIFCFRSVGSTSCARARIWSLPRIWQQALNIGPAYCIEILSERFDRLSPSEQERTLVHELLHVPKNFSGSLLPHRRQMGLGFDKRVELVLKKLKS